MLLTDLSKKVRNRLSRSAPPTTPYYWEYYNRCNYVVNKMRSLGRDNPSILDVGGATGQLLEKFGCKNVTIVDYLKGADVIGDGKALPFQDNAFDAVTAIDVFEHIERSNRIFVAREMLRVARAMVIIVAPQDTPLNASAEKTVLKYRTQDWLVEHARYGLVDFGDLEAYLGTNTPYRHTVEELDNLMNWVTMSLWSAADVSDIYQEIFPFENVIAFRRKALTVYVDNK
jgi:hypothetical protein